MTNIPAPAFWLGWAGVLPFAALSALIVAHVEPLPGFGEAEILRALVTYGMIILSFMGGVQWGLEMTRWDGKASEGIGFAASVIPALIAFAASFVSPVAALIVLAIGFLLLLGYDLRRIKAGLAPGWYASLRIQLSSAVILCLGAAAFARIPALG